MNNNDTTQLTHFPDGTPIAPWFRDYTIPKETDPARRCVLQEHGILIRDCQNFYGLSNQFFRITTQLPEENDALVQAVRQFMENCQNS